MTSSPRPGGHPRVSHPRLVHLALAAALALAPAAGAQAVSGHIVEQRGGHAVPGAHLVLRDLAGADVAQTESGPDGGFLLRAPGAGRYRILAERVGFGTTTSPVMELAAGQTVSYRLEAASAQIQLEGIVVQGRTRCVARAGSGPQTATLWDEARKALQSNRAANASGAYRYALQLYARELDRRGVVKAERRTTGTTTGNPFVTVPPELIQAHGYVAMENDSVSYYGPDANLLLSPAFQDDHCFWVAAPPANEPGLVGLAFEPLPGSFRRTDIRGTLWLDRATAELRRVDYQYTHLPWAREPSDDAGGSVRFRRLDDGRWIVNRWTIRMPEVVAQRMTGSVMVHADTRERGDMDRRVVGLHEEGGEVVSVAGGEGAGQALGGGGTLTGVVFDSTRAAPLAGARISLAGTALAATADSAGAYTLRDVPAGSYTVRLSAARLDSLGYTAPTVQATIAEGGSARADLAVPPLATVLAADCETRGPGTAPLVGMVRNAAGQPEGGVPVRIAWPGAAGAPPQALTATSDFRGIYRLCAAPAGVPLRLSVDRADAALSVTGIRLAAGTPRLQEIALPPQQAASTARAGSRPMVSGVVRGADGRPLRGVQVRVGAGAPLVTDTLGRFGTRVVPALAGVQTVTVASPELGERTAQVALGTGGAELDLRAGDASSGTLTAVVRRTVQLQGVTARAESRVRSLETSGFYERRHTGLGAYLTAAEIGRNPAGRLTNVLRTVSGVRVVPYIPKHPTDVVTEYRIASSHGGTRIEFAPCYMDVYLDGVKVQDPNDIDNAHNLDSFTVTAIGAIEVYRGAAEAPAQYRSTSSTCGVVLLWSRTADFDRAEAAATPPAPPPPPPTRPKRP